MQSLQSVYFRNGFGHQENDRNIPVIPVYPESFLSITCYIPKHNVATQPIQHNGINVQYNSMSIKNLIEIHHKPLRAICNIYSDEVKPNYHYFVTEAAKSSQKAAEVLHVSKQIAHTAKCNGNRNQNYELYGVRSTTSF